MREEKSLDELHALYKMPLAEAVEEAMKGVTDTKPQIAVFLLGYTLGIGNAAYLFEQQGHSINCLLERVTELSVLTLKLKAELKSKRKKERENSTQNT